LADFNLETSLKPPKVGHFIINILNLEKGQKSGLFAAFESDARSHFSKFGSLSLGYLVTWLILIWKPV
jgi:hypothetical protein